jgi:hemolysin activation/secretion protein
VMGQYATPENGQFFALGGGTTFRGYDLAERQGNMMWVGNVEVRWPLARQVCWNVLDSTLGVRNVWLATFYDVGAVYTNGRMVGGNIAHAVGGGFRIDVAVFSFLERATIRFDVGKPLNGAAPLQFWFGIQHAF